jgi:glycine cleavage system H protein
MRFTRDHQWIEPRGASARLGVTAYAADQLGDIIRIALPAKGAALKPGDAMGEVESVKAASELAAPLAGEVTAINAALLDTPELVNTAPETFGWLVELKLADPGQLDGLMDRPAYEAFLGGL